MTTLPRHALDLLAHGDAAMVTLAAVEGSAPREAGARMIVGHDTVRGTVGGGNLEFLLIDQARRLIASDLHLLQQDYPLGPLLAQCCGGHVRVAVERLDAASRDWLRDADAAERNGARYTLEGRIKDGRMMRKVTPEWPKGSAAGVDLLDSEGRLALRKADWASITERIAPVSAQLMIFGAGHVGRAVMHIAQTLPFRITWLDSRPELAGDHPALTTHDDPVQAAREAPPSAYFLILTHAHELDYQLVRAILQRGDASYCGLIGSATKRARFLSRLAKDGVKASGLTCPIGAGAIRSKHPAAIAVATAAELLVILEAAETALSTTNSSARRTSP